MPGPIGRLRNALLRAVAERAIFGGVQREAEAMTQRAVGRGPGEPDRVGEVAARVLELRHGELHVGVGAAGPVEHEPAEP
ncbi:hypothetical protein ACNJGI_21110, partial [Mycobacterium tuberculosis]